MNASGDRAAPATVRFARRPARGVLLGYSAPRVAAAGCGMVVASCGVFLAGVLGLGASAVLWLPLVLSAFVVVAGRAAVEWAPTALHFGLRRMLGQTEFRARPMNPRPAGTLALPGDAAALRLHIDPATGAAMIHDPHRQTLTAVLSVSHPAFALLDDPERSERLGRWARVLAQLAQSGTCAAVQVLEATIPDPAQGQREWWQAEGTHDDGFADRQYRFLLDQVRLDSSLHRSTISLSLDCRAAARAVEAAGHGVRGAAEVLRLEMSGLVEMLRQAGLRPGSWLCEAELAAIVRATFDPAIQLDARADPGANLSRAGPLALSESWDRLRHDSGFSSVLWIAEWPRVGVPPDFLHPIVFAPGVRRSLSILARPLSARDALRQIRRDKTGSLSDSAQKARVGQLADLADAQEYEDLLARERSLIAGHADLAFAGFVTLFAPTSSELDAAIGVARRAASQAMCELRPLYGNQLQALIVAALPLARSVL